VHRWLHPHDCNPWKKTNSRGDPWSNAEYVRMG
jgi:hypothetical protein